MGLGWWTDNSAVGQTIIKMTRQVSRGPLQAGLLWESGFPWLSEPYEVTHNDSLRATAQYREGCRHVTVPGVKLRRPW